MEKKENHLRKYLDDTGLNVNQFSKLCKVAKVTLYSIFYGKQKPYRFTALKICKATNGKLKLEDFGYE